MSQVELRSTTRLRSINGGPSRLAIRGVKGLLLGMCCGAVLLPFLAVISTSLAGPAEVTAAGGYVIWPKHPTLAAYHAILSDGVVLRALGVSVMITLVGTALSLVFTSLLAYALSRPGSFGHKPILLTVLFTFFFHPGMIPMYLLIKNLGLLDSYWSLILPTTVTAFNVVIMRAFFLDLPEELIGAARVDGASEIQTLTKIVLPLSRAALAVIGLFQAVAYWNAFFNALLYMNSPEKLPLQLVLRNYVVDNNRIGAADASFVGDVPPPQTSLQMAILVMSISVIALVYPFLQRHFAKGVLIGAVKG